GRGAAPPRAHRPAPAGPPPPGRPAAGTRRPTEAAGDLRPRPPAPRGGPPPPDRPSPRRILGVYRQACPPVSEHRPMARLLRIACFVAAPITAWAMLGVVPAAAQFFNPFEALFGQPPRPPSSVPSGRPQPAYPQYPDQRYPDQR